MPAVSKRTDWVELDEQNWATGDRAHREGMDSTRAVEDPVSVVGLMGWSFAGTVGEDDGVFSVAGGECCDVRTLDSVN